MPANRHPIHGCKDPLALACLQILIHQNSKLTHQDADDLAVVVLRGANPKLFEEDRDDRLG